MTRKLIPAETMFTVEIHVSDEHGEHIETSTTIHAHPGEKICYTIPTYVEIV